MVSRLSGLRLAAAALLGVVLLVPSRSALSATFTGRGTALRVTTPLTGTLLFGDTGDLPSAGGVRSATFLSADAMGKATAKVLSANTTASGSRASTTSSTHDLVALPGTAATLTATFVRSIAVADWHYLNGKTEIVNLTLAGTPVLVTGKPNQRVDIPGVATLVVNEQIIRRAGTFKEITVNALHLTVPGVAEVIVSHSKAGISGSIAKDPVGGGLDFVTGGGTIAVPGGTAAFGFTAGTTGGTPAYFGGLSYSDANAGVEVASTSVTGYTEPAANSRTFVGTCLINGVAGSFSVTITDNGTPGQDKFSISLSSGYSRSGTITAGDIELFD